ncbi:MAG: hypothetical protein ACFE8L_05310 [Candidatus Hodarchaeota archaeon]
MAEFELVKFIAMLISIISLINFPIIFKKRKDFIKYLPGLFSLILVLVFSSLDDLIFSDFFSLLEIIFLLLGAILLISAVFIEFKCLVSEKKRIRKKSCLKQENFGEV